ncbi:cilia- and flagella-associated protein 251-like [Tribolium madens]|uniref:cilia- and flagella-associated protein 251-like n=1 Tax=Tribolium madens TaxID=41895 RepID=UPI001CF7604B|nr:cilia- and flagella-associated protein 251-like [Tribolium madens]
MSEVEAVSANNALPEENSQSDKGVKSKKAKSPRLSTVDRAKEESEAITKGISSEVEGRRITRSAAKGVTATPPPPAKKERKSRGRPKKGSQNATDESDSHDESKDVTMTENESHAKNDESKKESQPVENNTHEEKEEMANNNAETTKEVEATENGAKEDSVDASTSGEEKKEEKSETPAEDAARPAEASEQPAE